MRISDHGRAGVKGTHCGSVSAPQHVLLSVICIAQVMQDYFWCNLFPTTHTTLKYNTSRSLSHSRVNILQHCSFLSLLTTGLFHKPDGSTCFSLSLSLFLLFPPLIFNSLSGLAANVQVSWAHARFHDCEGAIKSIGIQCKEPFKTVRFNLHQHVLKKYMRSAFKPSLCGQTSIQVSAPLFSLVYKYMSLHT